mmetsp:Transcript_123841/g.396435  ORF Transcript_123841/g.396435 Transcript_123841/m.396435 type:complete len:349 (-) Transcript_123841:75-1121(-)
MVQGQEGAHRVALDSRRGRLEAPASRAAAGAALHKRSVISLGQRAADAAPDLEDGHRRRHLPPRGVVAGAVGRGAGVVDRGLLLGRLRRCLPRWLGGHAAGEGGLGGASNLFEAVASQALALLVRARWLEQPQPALAAFDSTEALRGPVVLLVPGRAQPRHLALGPGRRGRRARLRERRQGGLRAERLAPGREAGLERAALPRVHAVGVAPPPRRSDDEGTRHDRRRHQARCQRIGRRKHRPAQIRLANDGNELPGCMGGADSEEAGREQRSQERRGGAKGNQERDLASQSGRRRAHDFSLLTCLAQGLLGVAVRSEDQSQGHDGSSCETFDRRCRSPRRQGCEQRCL